MTWLWIPALLMLWALLGGVGAAVRRRVLGPEPDGGEQWEVVVVVLWPHIILLSLVLVVWYIMAVPGYLAYRLAAGGFMGRCPSGKQERQV